MKMKKAEKLLKVEDPERKQKQNKQTMKSYWNPSKIQYSSNPRNSRCFSRGISFLFSLTLSVPGAHKQVQLLTAYILIDMTSPFTPVAG